MLETIRPMLAKKNPRIRKRLDLELKLTIKLRYMATGDSFTSLHQYYEVGLSTLSTFITEVIQAISDKLVKTYLKFPENKDN